MSRLILGNFLAYILHSCTDLDEVHGGDDIDLIGEGAHVAPDAFAHGQAARGEVLLHTGGMVMGFNGISTDFMEYMMDYDSGYFTICFENLHVHK